MTYEQGRLADLVLLIEKARHSRGLTSSAAWRAMRAMRPADMAGEGISKSTWHKADRQGLPIRPHLYGDIERLFGWEFGSIVRYLEGGPEPAPEDSPGADDGERVSPGPADAGQALRIGTDVRSARKARGWTNAQLAEAAGLAPNTVSAIENGKSVRAGNLRAVLETLGIEATPDEPAQQHTPEEPAQQSLTIHYSGVLLDSDRSAIEYLVRRLVH